MRTFRAWYQSMIGRAVLRDDRGAVDAVMVYRDIERDLDHRPQLAAPWLLMAQYSLPFDADTAQAIWDAFTRRFLVESAEGAWVMVHPESEVEEVRATCIAAFLARELGDGDRFEKLLTWADGHYEPRFDDTSGEFAYWFGLGGTFPRGQFNNAIMNAFVAPAGTWSSLLA